MRFAGRGLVPTRLWRGFVSTTLIVCCNAATQAAVEPLAVSQVAPGVYVQFGVLEDWQPSNAGNVANIGFIVGTRCVAVVDSGGTPQVGERLRAAIEHTTPLPVCYVINTHAHPDHMLGNVAFVPAAGSTQTLPQFVASARMPAALAARERFYLNALQRDFGVTLPHESVRYPTLLVDTSLDIDLGGRVLQLQAWPTAHTDHDLTVYDRTTRTLFLSDLLFAGHIPVLDGKLRGWLGVLDDIARIDVALAIPGHGRASRDWPAALAPERAYLQALLTETRAALKAGKTLRQAIETVAKDAAARWQLEADFHARNVTAAFAELEWED